MEKLVIFGIAELLSENHTEKTTKKMKGILKMNPRKNLLKHRYYLKNYRETRRKTEIIVAINPMLQII